MPIHNRLLSTACFAMLLAQCAPADAQSMSAVSESNNTSESTEATTAEEVVGYDRVREVLRKRCVTCHNVDELRGDLDMSNLNGILAGSGSGAVVVSGQPNRSTLYTTAAHLEEPAMPPNSAPIPARELDLLKRWIEGGLAEKSGAASTSEQQAPVPPEPLPTAMNNVQTINESGTTSNGLVPIKSLYQRASINALAAHAGRNLAAVPGQSQVVLLNCETGQLLGALAFPEGDVTALRFSQDGRWLVAAGGVAGLSGRVVGFDVENGQRVFELADENDTILCLDLSPDKQFVTVGGPAKVVRIYRVQDGSVVHTLRKHTDWVLTLRFSPDGMLLASGDRFGGLFVWNPSTGEEFQVLRGHHGPVHSVSWDGGSETLISGGEDGQIRIWNMHHGELTTAWDAGVGEILSLDSNAGKVVVGGRERAVVAWQGPELKLGRYETSDQVERLTTLGDRFTIVGDAAGELHLLDGSLNAVKRMTLPVGANAGTELLVRLDNAEQAYLKQQAALRLAADATSTNDKAASHLNDVNPSLVTGEAKAIVVGQAAQHSDADAYEVELASLEERIEFLRASQTRLAELDKSTAASLDAAVAALANLHQLQQSLREQQQLHARMLDELDRERLVYERLRRERKQSAANVGN